MLCSFSGAWGKIRRFTCRMRLISLAAQKFVANVSDDSLGIYKQRRHSTLARLKEQGLKDQKTVLTLEDTAVALQEVRVVTQKPRLANE